MRKRLVKIAATFFYFGYFPVAPGSLASVAGMLLSFCLHDKLFIYGFFILMVSALGFWASDRMEKITGKHDPSCIVIDEVVGAMIAFFMLPLSCPVAWTAFFLFRAFDMFKIYPINKFESMPGGAGVMMDDIIAGIYTNLTLQLALKIAPVVLLWQ